MYYLLIIHILVLLVLSGVAGLIAREMSGAEAARLSRWVGRVFWQVLSPPMAICGLLAIEGDVHAAALGLLTACIDATWFAAACAFAFLHFWVFQFVLVRAARSG